MHSYATGSYARATTIGAADAFADWTSFAEPKDETQNIVFYGMGKPDVIDQAPENYALSLERLSQLQTLAPNWDSYGAKQISEHAIFAARGTLRSVLLDDSPTPDVIPTAAGGVQLEWEVDDRVVEIALAPDGSATAFLDDGDEEVEGPLASLFSKVISAVRQMSPPPEPSVPGGVLLVMPESARTRHSGVSVFGQVAYA